LIGNIQDQDVSYLNGIKIGQTARDGERRYVIPKSAVRFGHDNVIAIRIIGGGGWKGITGWPLEVRPNNK
jgi:sialate O-acetylesterase